ncbi:MAG: hypothetical protein ACK4NC_03720 [Candidatus Gracilibacteria bacterium]
MKNSFENLTIKQKEVIKMERKYFVMVSNLDELTDEESFTIIEKAKDIAPDAILYFAPLIAKRSWFNEDIFKYVVNKLHGKEDEILIEAYHWFKRYSWYRDIDFNHAAQLCLMKKNYNSILLASGEFQETTWFNPYLEEAIHSSLSSKSEEGSHIVLTLVERPYLYWVTKDIIKNIFQVYPDDFLSIVETKYYEKIFTKKELIEELAVFPLSEEAIEKLYFLHVLPWDIDQSEITQEIFNSNEKRANFLVTLSEKKEDGDLNYHDWRQNFFENLFQVISIYQQFITKEDLDKLLEMIEGVDVGEYLSICADLSHKNLEEEYKDIFTFWIEDHLHAGELLGNKYKNQ